jgi:hypothetical protein
MTLRRSPPSGGERRNLLWMMFSPGENHARMEPCQAMILSILENGVKAGLLRAGAASPRVAGVGPAMLIHRAITAGPEISDAFLASIVDEVIMPLILA